MVGAGGGFVLVPILLLFYPEKEPETITAMALFVVWANAISGSLAYARQKRIDYRSGLWFAAGTLPGAVLGAVVVGYIPRRAFDAIFAVALAAIAVFIFLRSRPTHIVQPVTGTRRRHARDRRPRRQPFSLRLPALEGHRDRLGGRLRELAAGHRRRRDPRARNGDGAPLPHPHRRRHLALRPRLHGGRRDGRPRRERDTSWKRAGPGGAPRAGRDPRRPGGRLDRLRIHGQAIIRALAIALLLVGARLAVKAIVE